MLVRGGEGKGWGLGEEAGGVGRGQALQGLLSHLKELGGYKANILGVFACGPSSFQAGETLPRHGPIALCTQNVEGGFQTSGRLASAVSTVLTSGSPVLHSLDPTSLKDNGLRPESSDFEKREKAHPHGSCWPLCLPRLFVPAPLPPPSVCSGFASLFPPVSTGTISVPALKAVHRNLAFSASVTLHVIFLWRFPLTWSLFSLLSASASPV